MAGNDLGTDVSSSVTNLATKFSESFLKLLEMIFKAWSESPRRKLEVRKLKDAKAQTKQTKFLDKASTKSEISFKELKKVAKAKQDSIVSTGVIFENTDDMKSFAAMAKKQGLVFTGVYDPENGEYHIFTTGTDASRVKEILERIQDEKTCKAIDNKIEEIKAKGELTEVDHANIRSLEKLKQDIQDKYTYRVNQETTQETIDANTRKENERQESEQNNERQESEQNNERQESEQNNERQESEQNNESLEGKKNDEKLTSEVENEVFNKEEKKSTLEEVIDKYTNGELTKNTEVYVVDAKEPERYIVAHGEKDTFKGEEYIKTTYSVYNPKGEVKSFNDGRFEDRPKGHWQQVKNDMVEFGGFEKNSGLFRFTSKNEFQRWRELTNTQSANKNMNKVKFEEYSNVIEAKKSELYKKGYSLDDKGKVVCHKDVSVEVDNTEVNIKDFSAVNIIAYFGELGDDKYNNIRLEATEAIVIGRQITNYESLLANSEETSMAKTNVIIASTEQEKVEAGMIVSKLEVKRDELLEVESSLIEEIKAINGCQAKQEQETEMRESTNNSLEYMKDEAELQGVEHNQENGIEDYEAQIKAMREKTEITQSEKGAASKVNASKTEVQKGGKATSRDRTD